MALVNEWSLSFVVLCFFSFFFFLSFCFFFFTIVNRPEAFYCAVKWNSAGDGPLTSPPGQTLLVGGADPERLASWLPFNLVRDSHISNLTRSQEQHELVGWRCAQAVVLSILIRLLSNEKQKRRSIFMFYLIISKGTLNLKNVMFLIIVGSSKQNIQDFNFCLFIYLFIFAHLWVS